MPLLTLTKPIPTPTLMFCLVQCVLNKFLDKKPKAFLFKIPEYLLLNYCIAVKTIYMTDIYALFHGKCGIFLV